MHRDARHAAHGLSRLQMRQDLTNLQDAKPENDAPQDRRCAKPARTFSVPSTSTTFECDCVPHSADQIHTPRMSPHRTFHPSLIHGARPGHLAPPPVTQLGLRARAKQNSTHHRTPSTTDPPPTHPEWQTCPSGRRGPRLLRLEAERHEAARDHSVRRFFAGAALGSAWRPRPFAASTATTAVFTAVLAISALFFCSLPTFSPNQPHGTRDRGRGTSRSATTKGFAIDCT